SQRHVYLLYLLFNKIIAQNNSRRWGVFSILGLAPIMIGMTTGPGEHSVNYMNVILSIVIGLIGLGLVLRVIKNIAGEATKRVVPNSNSFDPSKMEAFMKGPLATYAKALYEIKEQGERQ